MFFLPAAIGTYLLVNVLCAFVALGIGFASGVWFFGAKLVRPAPPTRKRPKPNKNLKAQRSAERAAVAASRVADLTQNVASDVGDHAAKMKAISADLAGIDRDAVGANETVFTALDQMLAANSELQQRLEKAEHQLAAQAAEIRTHETEARTDSLTGISNRRAFDVELKRRFSEWQRLHTPCTLLMLDIDFFKKFNDTHGHQVGDAVLRQVAKVLKAQSRDMDLPCRYGGEEFGVILPATEIESACKVADRIRTAIEQATIECDGKSLRVTCSIGLSQIRPQDDIAQVIRRADEALYRSKKAGRNCGHWHDGSRCLLIDKSTTPIAETKTSPQPGSPDVESEHVPDISRSRRTETAPGTFIQMLKRRVTESNRFGIPLSLLHLKIEDYEVFKQKYGSTMARQILDFAEPALKKTLREMDALGRLGQGEFLVMLPGQTKAEAGQAAKRMRSATSQCVLPLVDRDLQLSFRHTIVELTDKETAQELLARVRRASASNPSGVIKTTIG